MKVTMIKGKPYIEVNERIKHFRSNHDGQIITSIISNENGVCIFKAEIIIDGVVMATGHAYEKEGSSFINKTSYIENCETSAVGRALGIFGIGIDASIASAEEVGNAIKQQKKAPESDFQKKMKGWAQNESDIYWRVLGEFGFKTAGQVPRIQEDKILKKMSDSLQQRVDKNE